MKRLRLVLVLDEFGVGGLFAREVRALGRGFEFGNYDVLGGDLREEMVSLFADLTGNLLRLSQTPLHLWRGISLQFPS